VVNTREASILTASVALNPLLVRVLTWNHADILALLFFIAAFYGIWKSNPLYTGLLTGLGFLTKIYPAVLLVPAFMVFKTWREKAVLCLSFILVSLFVSLPFLALDPLMYASTYTANLLRGPSESVFALLDGYYSHTGFEHPTFEAAIYSWQFGAVYPPSQYDHFRYAWNEPYLKYISLLLQLLFLGVFSLLAARRPGKLRQFKIVCLACLSFFMFSSFWDPIVAIPVFALVVFLLIGKRLAYQLLAIVAVSVVDSLHYSVWFPGLSLPFGTSLNLITVVTLRMIVLSGVMLIAMGT